MRRLVCIAVLLAGLRVASADPRDEMLEALAAAADTHPTPAALPVATAQTHLAKTPAVQHVPAHAAVIAGHAAGDQALQAQAASAALAHQAQAAAMAAAGQAQAAAARDRAAHHHPGTPTAR